MPRVTRALAATALLAGCGVKAPPRPPERSAPPAGAAPAPVSAPADATGATCPACGAPKEDPR